VLTVLLQATDAIASVEILVQPRPIARVFPLGQFPEQVRKNPVVIDDRTNLEDTLVNQTLQVRRHLQELPERRKSVRPEDTIEPKNVGLNWLSSHHYDFIPATDIQLQSRATRRAILEKG
jgi:hypothetical protein